MPDRTQSRMSRLLGGSTRSSLLLALLGVPLPGAAQDAVMGGQRATAHRGLRITAYPAASAQGEGAVGLLGKAAYGLGDGLVIDGRVGLYGDLTYFGAQARLAAGELRGVSLAVAAGLHRSDFDGSVDVFGLDAQLVASRSVSRSVETYGALDLDFERPGEPFAAFTRAHAVAGLEVRLSEGLGALGEVGVALNGASSHYFSAGLALSLR